MPKEEVSNDPLTLRDVVAEDATRVAIDETDLSILHALTEDSRQSNRQLASKLGISAPTVGERLSRLEGKGVIVRYTAEIDWGAVGHPQLVYVAIDVADRSMVPRIMLDLWGITEIESISMVTGEWDLLVRLRVRDYTHMRAILMDRVWELPGSSVSMRTMMTVAEMPGKNFTHEIIQKMIDDQGNS